MRPERPPDLRAAFLATTYGTEQERAYLSPTPGPAPGWASGSWAIVTAWNPGGRPAGAEANGRAAAALLARVKAEGFVPRPAHNGEGEWREEALLVPGARLNHAVRWGAASRQAAVLWGTGRRAVLVWLDEAGRVDAAERWWVVRREGSAPLSFLTYTSAP